MSERDSRNRSEATKIGSADRANVQKSEFRIRGKSYLVPMRTIEGREVISVGRYPRIAMLNDEEWLEGAPVADPKRFASALQASGLPADIFTFAGPIDAIPLAKNLHFELENWAVVRTDDYKAWWDGLPQETRKNVRRASRKGIEVRRATLDDDFAEGIKAIYDETPIRQGRKFWHYGKDLYTVKRENSTYLDRCELLGAYYSGKLVGFLKFVYVDDIARLMQILCLNAHQDKRPIFALLSKAIEICHQKRLRYFIYGKATYGRKSDTSIMEFKRRLGFEHKYYPRYYIPLSLRGRIALKLGAHKGWLTLLPPKFLNRLLKLRTWWLKGRVQKEAQQFNQE